MSCEESILKNGVSDIFKFDIFHLIFDVTQLHENSCVIFKTEKPPCYTCVSINMLQDGNCLLSSKILSILDRYEPTGSKLAFLMLNKNYQKIKKRGDALKMASHALESFSSFFRERQYLRQRRIHLSCLPEKEIKAMAERIAGLYALRYSIRMNPSEVAIMALKRNDPFMKKVLREAMCFDYTERQPGMILDAQLAMRRAPALKRLFLAKLSRALRRCRL